MATTVRPAVLRRSPKTVPSKSPFIQDKLRGTERNVLSAPGCGISRGGPAALLIRELAQSSRTGRTGSLHHCAALKAVYTSALSV